MQIASQDLIILFCAAEKYNFTVNKDFIPEHTNTPYIL